MAKITQEMLKELLEYDPESGCFIWLVSRGIKKGSIAGTKTERGYIQIKVCGNLYLAHRLAFLYMEGYFPENDVDHIDRTKDNNRWVNLREATRQCNVRNSNVQINNSSGVTGVAYHKSSGKWISRICVNNKKIHIGLYADFKKAVSYRWNAEVKYGFPNCNTTSSAFNYLNQLENVK